LTNYYSFQINALVSALTRLTINRDWKN